MNARLLFGLFAFLVVPEMTMAQDGEAGSLWQKACAPCHEDAATLARNLLGGDEAAKRAMLDGFLARHHAPDAAARTALIGWLLAQAKE